MNAPKPEKPSIAIAFDGVWLQGFADVHRSDREEYGWLFRIYASEQGDGSMDWNAQQKKPGPVRCPGLLPLYQRRDDDGSGKTITAGVTTIRRRKINPAGVLERVRLMKRR